MKRASRLSLILISTAALLLAAAATAAAKPGPGLSDKQVEALFLLEHPRGLNRFVRAVSDPTSRRYRDYASVEQLVERFGASKAHRKQAMRWLAERGLRGRAGATGTYVLATVARDRAARLLPRAGAARASSAGGIGRRVPAPLRGAVERVVLLSTRPVVHKNTETATRRTLAAKYKGYTSIMPHSGTAGGCAAGSSGGPGAPLEPFTPNQFLTAYGHAAMHAKGLQGQGQTVAVVEIDGFRHSDIVTYDKCFGVETPPIRVALAGIKKRLAPSDETTLDLEVLTVAAPKLDRILVYEGGESGAAIAVTAGAALGSPGNRPDVISISLGMCEQELAGGLAVRGILDNIFAVAAGAGISTLVSSGDTGSSGCRTETPEEETTALPLLAVSMPASSPYVTAVGGTNLKLNAKNRVLEELVWNDLPGQPAGGGGGGSILSPRRPWWQQGVHRYGPERAVPDIAALADIYPGYAYFCTAKPCQGFPQTVPGWTSIGGTSAASPLMAAGVALANQYAERRGQPPLGFLNPLLYRLGSEAKSRGAVFNDVVKGNNDLGRLLPPEVDGGKPLGCCSARVGYDWASGWGSLKVPAVARAAAAALPSPRGGR